MAQRLSVTVTTVTVRSRARLLPGSRHDLGTAQIRSTTDVAAGSRPPSPEADCSEGGILPEFSLMGGIMRGNNGIIPQYDRLLTMI